MPQPQCPQKTTERRILEKALILLPSESLASAEERQSISQVNILLNEMLLHLLRSQFILKLHFMFSLCKCVLYLLNLLLGILELGIIVVNEIFLLLLFEPQTDHCQCKIKLLTCMFILHLVASFDGLVNHWLRDYSFFPMEWFWHSCQKSIGHRCLYLFLDSRFYFIFLYVYPGHMKFDSYSFTVSFEIGTCESSNFVFLFEYYLAI